MLHGRSKWLLTAAAALGLFLAACSGTLPTTLPDSIEIDSGGDHIEFSGTIEAIDVADWTVSGVTFAVDSGTEIKGDFALGDAVKVEAMLVDDTVTATEVSAAESEGDGASSDDSSGKDSKTGETEFTGTVEAMGASSWTIDGVEVAIDSSTEIEGGIAVGDLVKVHAFETETGVLTAREIQLATHDDGEDSNDDSDHEGDQSGAKQEFTGTVESIAPDMWVVDGTTVLITADTEIKDGIQVGDMVKVEAFMDVDGNLVAHEIDFAESDDQHDGEEFELEDDETDDEHEGEHEESHDDSSDHQNSGHEEDD
jgi:hypothetical protein